MIIKLKLTINDNIHQGCYFSLISVANLQMLILFQVPIFDVPRYFPFKVSLPFGTQRSVQAIPTRVYMVTWVVEWHSVLSLTEQKGYHHRTEIIKKACDIHHGFHTKDGKVNFKTAVGKADLIHSVKM
jgi:hypothetical protein